MLTAKLAQTAQKLCQPGKGILAADESSGTIEKRFKSINLESTEANRKAWRELLFTTAGINKFISGVILYDETIRQGLVPGLKKQGIIPGIKVDLGAKPLAGFPGETITEGLDGLRERLAQYAQLGAQFTKWRAVINLGKGLPTLEAIDANAHALARFAALSQEAGLVPIVEPETLMEGAHTIQTHAQATKKVLLQVFKELTKYRVYLPGMLLKTNMVASGLTAKKQASAAATAKATIAVFRASVPKTVPGIVFLSGGLSPEAATVNLDAINKVGRQPWQLSFSYGRALQGEALEVWNGQEKNIVLAQKAFFIRAQKVARARAGQL
jgi:fructose-bisphosphate aldolase class I